MHVGLGAADLEPRPEVARGDLAHGDAVLVRDRLLAERVVEGRHEPDLVGADALAHVQRGHQVPDVRRVERAAEQRDLHHFTWIFDFGAPSASTWPSITALSSSVKAENF